MILRGHVFHPVDYPKGPVHEQDYPPGASVLRLSWKYDQFESCQSVNDEVTVQMMLTIEHRRHQS